MALATPCQTPGGIFSVSLATRSVEVIVALPSALELTPEQAEILEANLHNTVELALAPFFNVEDDDGA